MYGIIWRGGDCMFHNPFRNLDRKKLSRSSDLLKAQNDYFKIVNKRIVIFTFIIVILFSCIAIRLLFIQIRDYDEYTEKLASYSSKQQRSTTPRGLMYDRNGKAVANTVSSHNITYYPQEGITTDKKWELAKKFAKQFDYDISYMTDSDYQDMYMFLSEDSGTSLLKESELKLKAEETEKLIRSRITDEMLNKIANEATKKAYGVYQAMNKLPANQTKVVIEDASNEDVAYLIEHKSEYPGFDVDFGSWKREYPYKYSLRDVLGNVSTSKQGVPAEDQQYYEALGYSLTDRVGTSGLEKQYENLLSGTPKVSEITVDDNGIAVLNEISSGKKGYNLYLTIDIDLQQKVDEIVTNVLKKYAGKSGREYLDRAFVVLMNPNTGEIYALGGGMKNDDGEIIPYASGTYLETYQVGSVVKGATVYMMLNEGIQTASSTVDDSPMTIQGTGVISSYLNYGAVNAVTALQKSSNVYMWKSVIKLAGGNYVPNEALNISQAQTESTYELMHRYYSMFGLGVATGIDIPNEAVGQSSYPDTAGILLNYSIGQFETYTPIQLAQYVAMVANDGKRVQPKLVNKATEVNSDYVVFENKTKVLGTLGTNNKNIETVQEGFRACVTSSFCGVGLSSLKEDVAAKTGTAEVSITTKDKKLVELVNQSLIGYAPYDNPKVAFSCITPTSSNNNSSVAESLCSTQIMPSILEEFFKIYK